MLLYLENSIRLCQYHIKLGRNKVLFVYLQEISMANILICFDFLSLVDFHLNLDICFLEIMLIVESRVLNVYVFYLHIR